jgi:integrase
MASIWKRSSEGKFWIACYTDVQGRQRKASTKIAALEKNRAKALRVADELETAHKKRLTASQIVTLCGNLVKDLTGETMASATVRGFVGDFLSRKGGEVADKTMEAYDHIGRVFLEWLGPAADEELFRVEQKQLIAFRDHLRGLVGVATVNTRMKYLKVIFREARARRIIFENPFEGMATLKKEGGANVRRGFSLDEIRVVIRETAGTEWQSLVRFGLYTGQRLGDLAGLRWGQVDLVNEEIRITTGKTGRVVIVPICEPLKDHILSLEAVDDPNGFVHPKAGDLKVNRLSREFGEILGRCGFRSVVNHHEKLKDRDAKKRKVNELTFHSLRHSAVSMMKNAGISPAVVQDLVGHESAEMSAHYTLIDKPSKRKAVDSLPVI